MSDLLQIFAGNPLSTFLGKKIEAATRPELDSDDWALNIEICDIINENDDDAKDAARAIKKRLQQIEQDRNFTITNRTLTVLETCVNNCSHRFHILVMTKDFIQELVKLIGPRNNPPIELQERVLSLIENWADAFRGQPDLNGVVSVYNDLKAKGVTFPPRDPNSRVPIQTPQRTVPAALSSSGQSDSPDRQARLMSASSQMVPPAASTVIPAGQVLLEGEGYNKISQDLVVVQSSIEMFDDIIRVIETPESGEEDWRLAEELSITCRQMQDRIVDLIERIANEDLTIELLRLNDELNTTFLRYKSLSENRSSKRTAVSGDSIAPAQVPAKDPPGNRKEQPQISANSGDRASAKPKLAGVSSNTLTDLSLIDFNMARASGQESGNSSQKTGVSTAAKQTSVDPFDTSNIPSVDRSQPSLAEELRGLEIGGSKSSPKQNLTKNVTGAALPEEISSCREQDFAEIENWLSTDSGRDLASISGDMPSMEPISVPNSEFDNFIASRALAGSSATGSQPSKAPQKKPEPSV